MRYDEPVKSFTGVRNKPSVSVRTGPESKRIRDGIAFHFTSGSPGIRYVFSTQTSIGTSGAGRPESL